MNIFRWIRKKMCESGVHVFKPTTFEVFTKGALESICKYKQEKCKYCKLTIIRDCEFHRDFRSRSKKY
jgi:hypothetical protein